MTKGNPEQGGKGMPKKANKPGAEIIRVRLSINLVVNGELHEFPVFLIVGQRSWSDRLP